MELQSVCSLHHIPYPKRLSFNPFYSHSINNNQRIRLDTKTYNRISLTKSILLRVVTKASNSDKNLTTNGSIIGTSSKFDDKPEPYSGKSEEGKLVSSPFKDDIGTSFIWVLAPIALISSLLLPQFFLSGFFDVVLKDEILAGNPYKKIIIFIIIFFFCLLCMNIRFMAGNEFSLLFGLGYLAFALLLDIYRIYQLSKAAHFVERLIFFQVIGVLCLWSLITFLLGLFPSRTVAEKY
ncbi:hypothetical protein MKX01_042202 [Papaver californicum]|nr:hypothetical protein MKX01_042202 [Papaver californicum]